MLLLDSSGYAVIVGIRSTTLVCLLHGFSLLSSGISGKMTITLDITTIFVLLVVSMLSLAALPTTCVLVSQYAMISL